MKCLRNTIFVLSVSVLSLFSSCALNKSDSKSELVGSWKRTDGDYTIVISEFKDDGKLIAEYGNPTPINVGKAGWRIKSNKLEFFVELQDKNYPGSLYQLSFVEETNTLEGTYYQAVKKQYYDVVFTKIH